MADDSIFALRDRLRVAIDYAVDDGLNKEDIINELREMISEVRDDQDIPA